MDAERLIRLVEQAQQGNKNAIEELYLDAYNSIYRLALRILKNPEDAEDIAQEVFITVQQRISGLREPTAFYAWANQITANKCNRFFNRHKGLIKSDDEDSILSIVDDDPEHMPDKALDNEATRQIIMEVIDNLPDNQRMCILLFYYGQLTIADIAVALETNENTVKSRLSLARAKIRAALEEKAEKEGIKLWGVPLVLAPIVREAMENMLVPLEVQARMRDNITEQANAQAEYANQNPGGTNPNLRAENVIADSAVNVVTATAKTGGAALSTNVIIAIVCGVVLTVAVAVTAIFWQQISDMFLPVGDTSGIVAEVDDTPETPEPMPEPETPEPTQEPIPEPETTPEVRIDIYYDVWNVWWELSDEDRWQLLGEPIDIESYRQDHGEVYIYTFIFGDGLSVSGFGAQVDYQQAENLQHFHFRGIDGTSTRDDVVALMGQPDFYIDTLYIFDFGEWYALAVNFDHNFRVIQISISSIL